MTDQLHRSIGKSLPLWIDDAAFHDNRLCQRGNMHKSEEQQKAKRLPEPSDIGFRHFVVLSSSPFSVCAPRVFGIVSSFTGAVPPQAKERTRPRPPAQSPGC